MEYFAAFVAGLWSLGCFCLPLYAVWYLWTDREEGLALATLLIGWPIGVILSIVPWAIFADSQSSDLATLKKNAWFCSEKHSEVYTTYVKSGNSTVPITNTRIVCDQYNRK